MLIGNPGEAGDQHDDQQADQAHFGDVQAKADNQDQGGQALNQQCGALLGGPGSIVFGGVGGEHAAHVVRQQGAIAKPAQFLQQHAGHQAGGQYGQGHRCDLEEEVGKVPAHFMTDQQVLRLTHQGADTAQCRTDCAVHQQAAQKGAELLQVFMVQVGQVLIIIDQRLFAWVVA